MIMNNINWLQKEQLHLVSPKFRKMVSDAWDRGENVPYGVIYLSEVPPTPEDIEWVHKLVNDGVIQDDK
jgi:hypothetical protein